MATYPDGAPLARVHQLHAAYLDVAGYGRDVAEVDAAEAARLAAAVATALADEQEFWHRVFRSWQERQAP